MYVYIKKRSKEKNEQLILLKEKVIVLYKIETKEEEKITFFLVKDMKKKRETMYRK